MDEEDTSSFKKKLSNLKLLVRPLTIFEKNLTDPLLILSFLLFSKLK